MGSTRYMQRERVASEDGGLVLLILFLPIVGATFASKFTTFLPQSDGLSLGFPLLYLALGLGMLLPGRMYFDPGRLRFFCLMAGVLGALAAMRAEAVSLPSLALLLLLHLPYVFFVEANETQIEKIRRGFLNVGLFLALCGLAQYALQYVVAARYVFPLENFLPKAWLATGFNMQIPIVWGSNFYRANGIFMQEPSFYSQFLAIVILFELAGPSRLWRVALCAAAVLTSRSGTGLIVLAVCLPVLVLSRRRWDLLYLALALAPVLVLAAPYLHLDQILARIGEFGSSRSSAYERFVGGFHVFDLSLGSDPLRLLFGYGPGSYRALVQDLGYPAAEMALFKIVIEFGVVGALLYFGFVFYCVFSARGPLPLRLAPAVCLFLNGAYNTFVHSIALSLLVWTTCTGVGEPQPTRRSARVERDPPLSDPSSFARMTT